MPSITELLSLRDRSALITGASSGIGAAIARRFAEAGAALILVDIDQVGLETVRRELVTTGAAVTVNGLDLAHKAAIDALWDQLRNAPPDILVNNAGMYPFRDFLSMDAAFVARVLDVNFNAVLWMCQHFIKARLDAGRGGAIVNIGSIEAQLPFKKDLAHYSASKAGVIALTRALAKDYGRQGFRANVILPGGIVTSGTKQAAKQVLKLNLGLVKDGAEFMARLPLGRLGQPDEVARICLVLASDLSCYMTGAVVPVDGGFLSA